MSEETARTAREAMAWFLADGNSPSKTEWKNADTALADLELLGWELAPAGRVKELEAEIHQHREDVQSDPDWTPIAESIADESDARLWSLLPTDGKEGR
jgi:hypothetical protein